MPDAADIRFEYGKALAETVGPANGLTEVEWAQLIEETTAVVKRLNADRARTPYRDLPGRKTLSQVDEVVRSAKAKQGRFDDLVVLGIGGSALGTTALRTALVHPFWNTLPKPKRNGRPRLWVMDNVDPDEFSAMLEVVEPERTLFNVISKSGGTVETVAQLLVALNRLGKSVGKKNLGKHVVVTTDAAKGLLLPVAEDLGLERFVVPEGVGGRFSVLSPVGLLPAAMLGIRVRRLLAGAKAMDRRCGATPFRRNPAAQAAAVQVGLYRKGKPISVMMPYAAALRDVADWYRQLWAESLGKVSPAGRFVGPTPVRALGVTDQHSQVQLYREGPADKVFTIISVEQFGCKVGLPSGPKSLKEFDYLKRTTMARLLAMEEQATAWALSDVSGRPTTRIVLPRVSEETLGGLFQMLMVQTSIAGEMLRVNTYNQPGVEAGKEATRALMGKKGPIENPTAKGLPAAATTYEALRELIG